MTLSAFPPRLCVKKLRADHRCASVPALTARLLNLWNRQLFIDFLRRATMAFAVALEVFLYRDDGHDIASEVHADGANHAQRTNTHLN